MSIFSFFLHSTINEYLLTCVQKFECVICGHIYDEELGDPDGGIPAGTKWEDIPDDWVCPDCGVSKFDYEPLES